MTSTGSPLAAEGSPTDCYDFGGIPVAIGSEDARWAELLAPRYRPFACDRPPRLRLTYRVDDRREPSPDFLHRARQGPVRLRRAGSRLVVDGVAFRIDVDRGSGTGEVVGPLATYPIDFLIQALWYEHCPDGLIFHAAALADGDRGWLLSGPSGTGKSTLSGLFPEHRLCDELAGVSAAGEPRVTALPFWNGRRGSAPLEAIYLLRHGLRNERRRLEPSEACERLRRQVVWPDFDAEALRRAFTAFFDLLEKVPAWELAFRPEREIWTVLAGDDPS